MKRAFTLSELLIAISIIGIILILTIPPVFDNMVNKNRVAALQRVYLSLTDSVKIMMQEERASSVEKTYLYMSPGENVDGSAGEFIKKYYKLSMNCGTKKTPCLANSYKTLDGANSIDLPDDSDLYCVVLATKAAMCIVPPQSKMYGRVIVDVNSAVAPNVAGRDLFLFYIYPDGHIGDRRDNDNDCSSNKYAVGCFKKLVKSNWVMDY